MKDANYWIERLKLLPHPEGGFYREVFRSETEMQRSTDGVIRSACTSIYYLLQDANHSAFHRIKSHEIWYFHKGQPLNIYIIDEHGFLQTVELSDSESGALSFVVPANLWFAAEVANHKGFALVSCAVAPGFEFEEFELADTKILAEEYPAHKSIVNKLSK